MFVCVMLECLVLAEIELSTKCVVEMEENQTILQPPPSNTKGESRYSASAGTLSTKFQQHTPRPVKKCTESSQSGLRCL